MLKKIIVANALLWLTALAYGENNKTLAIVSASSPITQIISAFDKEDLLVGIDKTSHIKESLADIPDIGYRISLSSEGILSLRPNLIFLAYDSGSINVVEQLKNSGIEIIHFDEFKDVETMQSAVTTIAEKLAIEKEGEALNMKIASDAQKLAELSLQNKELKGFFVLQESKDSGSLQISGRATSANKLLELLNIENIFAKEYQNYRPVSLENQIQTHPDVVLIGKRLEFDSNDVKMSDIPPFELRKTGMKRWPDAIQPKCVFEVNMSNYLVYGIHIFNDSHTLLNAINECLAE